MPGVIPFQTLSNADRPALGELTIALGAEFATPDAEALDAAVARIAADLAPLAGVEPERQLLRAEAVFAHHLHVEEPPSRATGPDAVVIGHPGLSAPVLLAATPDWHLLDARDLEEPSLAWQCAHEAASLLLGLLLERTRQLGLLAEELHAAELCLLLPVEPDEHARLEHQLAVVRARLN
jgi:hypothetical protein